MSAAARSRSCTLHVLLASQSRAAVIYRRGPTRHTALIGWDRATDTFETGQWFKGKVYPDRSALAPDGAHLLTFMATFRPPFRTWTALSRPPWFTALALWPKGNTWGGGGTFVGDRAFALDHNSLESTFAPGFSLPEGFVLLPPGPATRVEVARALSRDPQAWQVHEGADRTYATRSFERDGPCGLGLARSWQVAHPAKPWQGGDRFMLRWARGALPLDGVGWVDFDANGDLLFAIGGRLHRCAADAAVGATCIDDLVARARLLADFTDLTFRAMRAPYRSGWVDTADVEGVPDAFTPVLDRVTREDRRQRHRERQVLRRQQRDRARW